MNNASGTSEAALITYLWLHTSFCWISHQLGTDKEIQKHRLSADKKKKQ